MFYFSDTKNKDDNQIQITQQLNSDQHKQWEYDISPQIWPESKVPDTVGTPAHGTGSDVSDKQTYKFVFNLTLPRDELFHSAHLRAFLRIRRKAHEIAGK